MVFLKGNLIIKSQKFRKEFAILIIKNSTRSMGAFSILPFEVVIYAFLPKLVNFMKQFPQFKER